MERLYSSLTQLQLPLVFLSHVKGDKSKEALVKIKGQGHRPTKYLKFNHEIIDHFPSLTLSYHTNRAPV